MKKKLFTNRFVEMLLLTAIRLTRSKSWIYKFVPENTDYPSGSLRNVKRQQIHYTLDISDYQEWLVYFYCKSDSSDYILNYLGQSEAIFDIGANIGQTALNMLKTQKSKGLNATVYAFEPYPRTFHKLETNISLNNNGRVKAYNLGLSTEKGLLHMMQHSPSNSGGFRMTNESTGAVSVPVISLDEFISENHISQVDFIKIDVEGFELQVLKGAEETIKRFKPVLIFEYSVENIQAQGGNISDTLTHLLNLNYQIHSKEGVADQKSILQLPVQTDLICIPN